MANEFQEEITCSKSFASAMGKKQKNEIIEHSEKEIHELKIIEVKEFCKMIRFCKNAVTASINAERLKTGTFFVTNVGASPLSVTLETSADQCGWIKDCAKSIDVGETHAVVGKYYGKYYRLKFVSEFVGMVYVQFIGQFYT